MTREEAIRILDPETTGEALAEIEYYGGFSGRTAAVQAVEDACILAVAALREQEERRWIPVTERLPECGKRVLATDGGFVGEFYINKRGQWQRYNVNDSSLLMALDILFWMPLPEPPKGECIMDDVKDYPPYLDYPKPRKTMTNADRIRAMSDEELAVFLSRDLKEPCDYCQLAVFEGACTETLCEDAMMKWLQQPAEEDS